MIPGFDLSFDLKAAAPSNTENYTYESGELDSRLKRANDTFPTVRVILELPATFTSK